MDYNDDNDDDVDDDNVDDEYDKDDNDNDKESLCIRCVLGEIKSSQGRN